MQTLLLGDMARFRGAQEARLSRQTEYEMGYEP
jgi:hypothetical protein